MPTVSSDWTPRQLKHFLEKIVGGGTPSRKVATYWEGEIPWASVKDFQDDKQVLYDTIEHISIEGLERSASNLIYPQALLVCVRMAVGKAAIVAQPIAINQDVKALYTNDLLLPKYLLYLLHINRQRLEATSIGSTVKGLSFKHLLSLPISVPSLYAQRKILEILDTIDEQIQHTEQLIAKLKNQRAGLLYKLLTCGTDEHGQLRVTSGYSRTSLELDIKKFPGGWKIRPLGTIAEVRSGITLNKKLSNTDAITLPYLRVANVQDGYLDLSEIKTVSIAKDNVSKYLLQSNDVLMIEGGDFDKLGRGTIWRGQISPCLHQNHIFRVRPDIRYLLPEFLTLLSGSSYGKRFFMLSSKQSTNLASINSTQLKSFPIPCPSIAEQGQILRVISEYDDDMHIEETHLEKLKVYKTGLMRDLLVGNVRLVDITEESKH